MSKIKAHLEAVSVGMWLDGKITAAVIDEAVSQQQQEKKMDKRVSQVEYMKDIRMHLPPLQDMSTVYTGLKDKAEKTVIEAVENKDGDIIGWIEASLSDLTSNTRSKQGEELDEDVAECFKSVIIKVQEHELEIKRLKKSVDMNTEMRTVAIGAEFAELKPLYKEFGQLARRYSMWNLDSEDFGADIKVTYVDHAGTQQEEGDDLKAANADQAERVECMRDAHLEMEMYEPGSKDTNFWREFDWQNTRSRVFKTMKRGKEIKKEIETEKQKLSVYKGKKREEWMAIATSGPCAEKTRILKLVGKREKQSLKAQEKLQQELDWCRIQYKYLAVQCNWVDKTWGLRRFINKGIVGMPKSWYEKSNLKALQRWSNLKEEKKQELLRTIQAQ